MPEQPFMQDTEETDVPEGKREGLIDTSVDYVKGLFAGTPEASVEPRQEPTETWPAPPRPEGLPTVETRRLSFMQDIDPIAGDEELQHAQEGFFTAVGNEVQDYGFTSTMTTLINDASQLEDDDEDYQQLQTNVKALLQKHNLPDSFADDVLDKAANSDHAEDIILRTKRLVSRMPAREQMGLGKSLTVGLTGFIADPANLIPAAVLVKAAAIPARFVGTQALKKKLQQSAAMDAAAKTTTLAAFGAAEEAFRTAPRLQTDLTFGYEEYLQQIGYGALFGGAIGSAVPVGKFVVSKTHRAVAKAIDDIAEGAINNATLRTGVNVMATAAKGSAKAARNGNIRAAIKEADIGATVRNARNKANEQIRNNKVNQSINDIVTSAKQSLNDTTEDALLKFTNSIKEVASAAVPEGKFKEVIKNLNEKLDDVIQPKPTGESVGAAARKETTATKVGDTMHDAKVAIKDAYKEAKKPIQQQLDDIDRVAKEAKVILSDVGGEVGHKARAAIDSVAASARRAVEERATRQGIKIQRKKMDVETSKTRIRTAIDNVLAKNAVADKNTKLNGEVMNRILNSLGIVNVKGGDLSEALADWVMTKNPRMAKERITHVRDVVNREYTRARERLEEGYTGNPADKEFLKSKQVLKDAQDRFESLADWAGMLHSTNYRDLGKLEPRWGILSKEYEDSMGADRSVLHKEYEKLAQRFISKQFGTLTESLSSKLVRTKVPLAEWMALNILELPAGSGGKVARNETAAIMSQIMEAEIQVPLNKAWWNMMDEAAKELGYGRMKRMFLRTGSANDSDLVRDIARKVMLEMNGRQMGVTSAKSRQPSYVKKFADELEVANDKAYNLQLEHGVDGITGHNKMKAYMKQSWNDGEIQRLITDPEVGKQNVIRLMAKSLSMRAGDKLSFKEANDLAEAIIDTKLAALQRPQADSFGLRGAGLESTMETIDNIVAHMNRKGKTSSIEAVLNYTKSSDGGGPGYINKRFLNLDYRATINSNGREISIMDLLDNDVIANANRYNKEASGRSAIAKASNGMLRSDEDVHEFLGAVALQAQEMGTYVNTQDMRNVFKQIMGLPFDGVLPLDIRRIRDGVSLAGMNGLGESQLAELGLAVNRGLAGLFGTNQVLNKSLGQARQFVGVQLTDAQKKDTKFLGELQEFSRLYENMHHLARNNVHFDARQHPDNVGAFSKLVNTATGGKYRPTLQYLQTRATAYSAIRTMEEQIAMAGLMQDAIKAIKTGQSFTTANRFKDVGLDLDLIKRKLDDGSIVLRDDGTIDTLNMERWSKADNYKLGVALRRHSGQQVQIAFAGEMSPLMTNPQVAFLMQFKSYPMLAAEKQMARSAMFGDKEAAMGIVLNAASSAGARYIRYLSLAQAIPEEKRERYLNRKLERDFAHDTVAYMGIVGMMVNSHDMVRDVGFGDSSVADQIPVTNWANNYIDAVKSAGNIGDMDERDIANMQRGAPIGTIAQVNVLAGILRTMMDTDSSDKDFVRQPQNRGN